MVPTNQTFTLCSILEKDKLNGRDSRHLLYTQFLRKIYFTNYVDWIHNLRIVLRVERKGEILDIPFLEAPADNTSTIEKNAYRRACDADLGVSCLVLACMEQELQMQFKNNRAAYDISIVLVIPNFKHHT